MPSAAVILAAGEGRRMGGAAKAGLRLPSGETFLARIVATAREAGVDRIVVVAGVHDADPPSGVEVVRNPRPDRGMLSSLQAGLRALRASGTPGSAETGAALLWPVDCPRAPAAVVCALLDAVEKGEAAVAIPSHARRAGHPVGFDCEVARALLAAPLESSARAVLRGGAFSVRFVEVDAPEVLDDVDTPEDHRRLLARDRT